MESRSILRTLITWEFSTFIFDPKIKNDANARNCGSGKIKGARNCGYARMEKLTCAVFPVFSRVEDGSEVRFSQLCKLLFLRLLLAFLCHFAILYSCSVNEPGSRSINLIAIGFLL